MTAPALHLTARSPEDMLAVVPVVLGFAPHESVVMLTFGGAHAFHARVDLPAGPAELAAVGDQLLDPVRRHAVRQVVLVLYTADARLARRSARCLTDRFARAGVRVLATLRADGERWWQAVRPDGPGVPYDLSTHPFSARAVLEGRVLLGSREELRSTVAAQPELVAGVVAALAGPTGDPPDAAWVAATVRSGVRSGARLSDVAVARLLRALLDPQLRDAAWAGLSRATAREHVAFWVDVVRRSPDPLVAGPAALLGLAAWQLGHGALAWCALDRCADAEPEHPLAVLVTRVLEEAVPPEAWEEVC